MEVSYFVHLVTSTARWLHDDDDAADNDDIDAQTGPRVTFSNLLLFNNICTVRQIEKRRTTP
jgi:hypothetical protein